MLNDPSKDRSVWLIGIVHKVFSSGNGIICSAEIRIQEDDEEKIVTQSTGRLVLLEAAKEYREMTEDDSNSWAEDVASPAPSQAVTQLTDDHRSDDEASN